MVEQLKVVSGGVTPVPQITGDQQKQLLQANAEPTPKVDYDEASNYRGNYYVLSPSNGTVYVINKTTSGTPVATFPLKQFLSIGIKK